MRPELRAIAAHRADTATRPPRVLVFTTPTCLWCSRAKAYLRERHVKFREVDVSRDAAAARDLMRRTGQKGVPVIEIDGLAVVGFDRGKIDRLLQRAA
jgi:glutaredoxin 3